MSSFSDLKVSTTLRVVSPLRYGRCKANVHWTFCTPLRQRTSHRPISNGQLHALRHFHLRPIYPVLSGGSPGIAPVDISS